MTNDVNILSKIGEEAMWMQLAEECSELSQAALKMARIIHNTNPTPITHDEALRMVFEEYTDIVQCASYLSLMLDYEQMKKKETRWINRIMNQ